ncbi:hypothetical protein PILCRDRAFT_91449 [Piloderma croceum F 1598]|uniref:DUF6534 domain-containing protein n=1 Tax=Piloderma croceum (strain F 1598) TaxID=765440 RepID=A0A0C3EWD1_PILCF|nr:hypothetical protein PILCRDRAFT_91449 [Piloderma croceum F 1598]
MLVQLKLYLGAIYLGNLVAAIFYGITCFQTFTYYQLFDRDRLTLKLSHRLRRILDTFQTAMASYTVYIYAVSDWHDPVDLGVPLWTFWVNICLVSLLVDVYVDPQQAQVIVTGISDFVIRCIYGTRIWILSKNAYLTIAIALSTIFVVALVLKSLLINSDVYLNYFFYLALGSAAVADIIIGYTLCVLLFKNPTHVRQFYIIVLIVIVNFDFPYTSAADINIRASRTQYATVPDLGIFAGLFASFGKLYFNALLASLNARYKLREEIYNGETIVFDTMQFGSPAISR